MSDLAFPFLVPAGMDPISRRAVWDAISAAKSRAAIVLTTHSMEEADALGDRIAIMVRGRMRVLGGSLTLKQKYGNGYQVSSGEVVGRHCSPYCMAAVALAATNHCRTKHCTAGLSRVPWMPHLVLQCRDLVCTATNCVF